MAQLQQGLERSVGTQMLNNEIVLDIYSCGLDSETLSLNSPLQFQGSDNEEGIILSSASISRDSSLLGDLQPHERLVIGSFIDPSICSGFMYRVRPLDSRRPLFQGKALRLQSIGMGYGKRITFASEKRNSNENYFWSDSFPSGYGFSIHVINPGEKYTICDANHLAIGTCEIIEIEDAQLEIDEDETCIDQVVTKHVEVDMLCNVEWYDDVSETAQVCRVAGVAVVTRRKSSIAQVSRLTSVSVGHHRGLTLEPGVDDKVRCINVDGAAIGDVPARFTVSGLESYELPVIGTYVDPRIAPGFFYSVRPAHGRRSLFGGKPLLLKSIGPGYGKRITFEGSRFNCNNNFFWSDSFSDGLGFSICVVFPGMEFIIEDQDGDVIGRAQVFKADSPQVEEHHSVSKEGILSKRVRVDITCHITIEQDQDVRTLRVNGIATVEKTKREKEARVSSITNIGIASQLYVMFMNKRTTLTFRPVQGQNH